MTDPVPDYCPFCGARLRDGGLGAHLDRHDDCTERFSARREGLRTGPNGESGLGVDGGAPVRAAVLAVVVGVVLAYSLFIAQRLLLGSIASAIVVVAFLATTR